MRFIQVHVAKNKPQLINVATVKYVLPVDLEDGGGCVLFFDQQKGFQVIETYQQITEMLFYQETIIENNLDRIGDILKDVVKELKRIP